MIAASFALLSPNTAYPGWWTWLPVGGAALSIYAGPHAGPNRTILRMRPVANVGRIAYPLYLWHWPLLAFARVTAGTTPLPTTRALLCAFSVGLAAATYRWIETSRRDAKLAMRLLIGGSLLLAPVGLLMLGQEIQPRSSSLHVERIVEAAGEWDYPSADLQATLLDPQVMWRKPAGPGAVLFLGDSNAEQYWPRVQRLIDEHGPTLGLRTS